MIAALILATIGSTPVQLPAAWNKWKYVRTIATPLRGGTVGVVVPPTIFANAQPSLDDLRVVDAGGAEVPFALVTPTERDDDWTDASVTDRGFVAGRYSQAVADLTARHGTYGALDIATPLGAFSTRVDVDASDDGTTWRTIRTGAPIYDYESDGLATNTIVTFPPSTARFVRVRVLDPAHAFPISEIRFTAPSTPPEETRYRATIGSAVTDASADTSTFALAGIAFVPVDRIEIAATTMRYSRDVDVETSDDGKDWATVTSGTIARGGGAPDQTTIPFADAQAALWRVEIHNGNDRPLQNVTASVYGVPQRLVFDADPSATYRLIYGNPVAQPASYDYAKTHASSALLQAGGAALGVPFKNAAFVTAEVAAVPWSERNPWLLWIALAVAVVGIGTVAVRTMGTNT